MSDFEFIKGPGGTLIPSCEAVVEKMKAWKIGDVITGKFTRRRNGKHHRKGRVLLEAMFENQDYYDNIDVYHHHVKLKIGLFDLQTAEDGTIFPIVKSTRYEDMGQEDYNQYYQDLITYAIQDSAIFEGKSIEEADAFVDMIIGGFA